MSITINNVYKAYGLYQPERKSACSRTSRADEKRDIVAFSSQAQDYMTAIKSLSSAPDIRADKVEDIKAHIEAGKYDVPTSAIASKLLSGYYNEL